MVKIRILRKRVPSCIVGTHCTFILMRTVRIVKNNYLLPCIIAMNEFLLEKAKSQCSQMKFD